LMAIPRGVSLTSAPALQNRAMLLDWTHDAGGWISPGYAYVSATLPNLKGSRRTERIRVHSAGEKGDAGISDILSRTRTCKNIFGPLGGNRTCFNKCK
jgi:beta-mannanase